MSQARLYLMANKPDAHHIASILDPVFEELGLATALFEKADVPDQWCFSIYVPADEIDPWRKQIHERLPGDMSSLSIEVEHIEDIDWVSSTLKDLSPVRAGRFFVHGSHDRAAASRARIPVQIDAGQAFGTGHHGTTAGCLLMLERILKRRCPHFSCDVGTGSAVLAIALAKATRTPVLATDIDPVATRVARANCVVNGVAEFVRCETVADLQHRAYKEAPRADLVVANILARPLEKLAAPISRKAAPGADIILSGLMPQQGRRIRAAYRQHGMVFRNQLVLDGWLTLLLRRT